MPDTQLAELPEAGDGLRREDVQLASLEGIVVGLRVTQRKLDGGAAHTSQNDVDVGVRPCPSLV